MGASLLIAGASRKRGKPAEQNTTSFSVANFEESPHKYLEEVKQRLFADSGGQRWENGRQSMAGEKMDKVKLGEGEMDGVAFQHLDDGAFEQTDVQPCTNVTRAAVEDEQQWG